MLEYLHWFNPRHILWKLVKHTSVNTRTNTYQHSAWYIEIYNYPLINIQHNTNKYEIIAQISNSRDK